MSDEGPGTAPGRVPPRAKLAMDLHDGVMASLGGLALSVAAAEGRLGARSSPARTVLRDARAEITRVMEAVRAYIGELERPPQAGPRAAGAAFASGDLRADLAALAAEAARSTGVRVHLALDEAVLGRLRPEHGRELAFVAREAVTNAVRHGRAATVWIALSDTGAGAMLTVRDDGVGFEASRRRSGRGRRNIAARAEAVGAAVVTALPEIGTVVWVTVPLDAAIGARGDDQPRHRRSPAAAADPLDRAIDAPARELVLLAVAAHLALHGAPIDPELRRAVAEIVAWTYERLEAAGVPVPREP